MGEQWMYTGILAAVFLALFGLAEWIHHKGGVGAEMTRKLVHAVTGLITLLFPILIHNKWLVFLLCLSFALILLASLKWSLLRSINGIDRKSHGSVSYPFAVFGAYCFYDWMSMNCGREMINAFYIPVLVLGVSDPLAAICGKRWPRGRYKVGGEVKTLVGVAAFFISALVVCLLLLASFNGVAMNASMLLGLAFSTAATSSIAEALTSRGFDNLTIPAACAATYLAFNLQCVI